MSKYSALCTILAVGMLALPGAGYAQQDDVTPRKTAFFRHVEPGQATMRVSVWGDVDAPGRYEVEAGTDLLELLFLAGGTSERVRHSNEKRKTAVVLSRKVDAVWAVIFEAPLDEVVSGRRPYPALQDEDLLKIDTVVSRTFSWRDAFTVIGAVGTLALVAERLTRISN